MPNINSAMSPVAAFNRFAKVAARFSGRPACFVLAVLAIVLWLATGPVFAFSDTWQLVINTGTTVVTFLMVFLIQNTQIRDTEAMQIKLDELIRATESASNALLDLEELDERTLDAYRRHYELLAEKSRSDSTCGQLGEGSGSMSPLDRPTPPGGTHRR